VGPESVVAELSGTGQYQVLLTVPQADLPLILPLDDDGQRITVLHELGQQRLSYQGRLLQLLPSIDERGRLAQILIAIDDPLQATGMPLLLGSFVEVHIRAAQARDYIVVPSDTVHRDNTIYIMQDGELALRQVGIARRGREETWISEGLEAGTSVISSPLPNPVPGMSLRVARNGDAQATDASRQEADE
ncbi:MAG: efflux RND transporter periplasmic adaptor subunit, partial [Planctomycetota bacterium]